MAIRQLAYFSPGRFILGALATVIGIGTLLLSLPWCRTQHIPLLDLIFTATSSICVTGAFTVPLDAFTIWGHIVILLLLQIGGIGIMTLTLFLLSFLTDFGLTRQFIAGKLLDIDGRKNIEKVILFIVKLTIGVELIGALCMLPVITRTYTMPYALFVSTFHAISSFCNSGITLFENSLIGYKEHYPMLLITSTLMIIGGLGFITWQEIIGWVRAHWQDRRYVFSLQSKIILIATPLLILGSTLIFLVLEHTNAFKNMSGPLSLTNAFFQAVSFRSGGFLNVPISTMQLPALFMVMVICFIGASPGSTGSGIKIIPLVIFLGAINAAISGRTSVDLKGRRIPIDQVFKAITIVSLSIMWIAFATLCLLITEPQWSFFALFFEAVSSFATLGVSTGITPTLSTIGKSIVILSMIVGRVGSLTLILAFIKTATLRKMSGASGISYPEERVLLS